MQALSLKVYNTYIYTLTISILDNFLSNRGLSNSVMDLMMLLYLDTMVSSLVAVVLRSWASVFLSNSLADGGRWMLNGSPHK